MRLAVTDQSGLLREGLPADITNVRPHARVYQQVLPIGGSARERLAADVTVVRSVAGVRHHVLLQPVILREGLAALFADEALPALVLQQDVLIEILLRDHTPLADLALVLRLEVRPLLVHVERIAVGARFAAHVADYRALLVLEAYVQPHVTLHLELLAAILAIVLVLGRVLPLEVLLQPTSALTFKPASVARILFLRPGFNTLGATAPPFPDHASRGMLSADVRVESRLVRALVAAEVASVRHALLVMFLRALLLLLALVL